MRFNKSTSKNNKQTSFNSPLSQQQIISRINKNTQQSSTFLQSLKLRQEFNNYIGGKYYGKAIQTNLDE